MILENIIDEYLNYITKNSESVFPIDSPHTVIKEPYVDNDDVLDIEDIESILSELNISP